MMRAIVLVPAPEYPEAHGWAYDVQEEALRQGGFAVEPRPWTEQDGFDADIVMPLVAWGYHLKPDGWDALLDRLDDSGIPVANPVSVLRWNSNKHYLTELAERGVPTIETRAVAALTDEALVEARRQFGDELVVKPPMSAAADGTYRLGVGDTIPVDVLGKPMLVQPFLRSIADEGEYSLLMFDGKFSHAVVKRPAAGDYRVQPHLGGQTHVCEPPEGAVAIAEAALACAPEPTAYARVDMVRGNDGQLRVIELELIEPSLWLEHSPDGGESFVAAIRRRARP